jgi:hypothetical protein
MSHVYGPASLIPLFIVFFYALTAWLPEFEYKGLRHSPVEKNLSLSIAVLSFASSLVTPWGINIYTYVFRTVTDKSFSLIQEWQPPPFNEPMIMLMTVGIVLMVTAGFLFSQKPVNVETVIISLLFVYLSLSGFRYYPLAAIPAAALLGELWGSAGNNKKETTRRVFAGLLIGIISVFLFTGIPYDFDQVAEKNGYPVGVLDVVGEKVLNPYDWGGYLIYKGIPVYIDGRADIYRWEGDVYDDLFSKLKGSPGELGNSVNNAGKDASLAVNGIRAY